MDDSLQTVSSPSGRNRAPRYKRRVALAAVFLHSESDGYRSVIFSCHSVSAWCHSTAERCRAAILRQPSVPTRRRPASARQPSMTARRRSVAARCLAATERRRAIIARQLAAIASRLKLANSRPFIAASRLSVTARCSKQAICRKTTATPPFFTAATSRRGRKQAFGGRPPGPLRPCVKFPTPTLIC